MGGAHVRRAPREATDVRAKEGTDIHEEIAPCPFTATLQFLQKINKQLAAKRGPSTMSAALVQ